MSTATLEKPVIYPESDGKPIADNTLQFRWIATIEGGLEALFAHDPDVFVAGDLLWYPVEGDNRTRTAPDALVAFGRPKGDRGSYRQWEENGQPPQVVFEVLSPGNRAGEMRDKARFYDRYGVEEYYVYDPDRNTFEAWGRSASGDLAKLPVSGTFTSPRLGVRFDMTGPELVIYRPDGERFKTVVEITAERDRERSLRATAEREREQAEREREQAEREREQAEARADRLAARLRALGIDPDAP